MAVGGGSEGEGGVGEGESGGGERLGGGGKGGGIGAEGGEGERGGGERLGGGGEGGGIGAEGEGGGGGDESGGGEWLGGGGEGDGGEGEGDGGGDGDVASTVMSRIQRGSVARLMARFSLRTTLGTVWPDPGMNVSRVASTKTDPASSPSRAVHVAASASSSAACATMPQILSRKPGVTASMVRAIVSVT